MTTRSIIDQQGNGRSAPSSALLTDDEVFGAGPGDAELLSDDFVFGGNPLPTGVAPSAGRSAAPMGRPDPRLSGGGPRAEPFRDKREAIDDAVDRIAMGADAGQVFDSFGRIGVSREEIIARGKQLNTSQFVPDTRPVTVRDGAASGSISAVEPTAVEGVANVGRRAAARASQAFTGVLANAGALDPQATAQLLARDEKRAQAAPVGSQVQRELENLGRVTEMGQVPGALADNWRGAAVMLAESVLVSAPALAVTAMGLPRVAMAGGVALSSGSLEYGMALSEALGNRGVSLLDVDKVAGLLQDEKFVAEVRERGTKRGLAIGLIDGLTAGIAGKFVEPALRAVQAGNVVGREALRKVAAASAAEIGIQSAGGAGGEALGQALVGEYKPLDIVMEAMAEGVSAPFEVASNLRDSARGVPGGALAQLMSTPERDIARAIDSNVENTYFRRDAIDGFARRAATDPNFSDPQFIDPQMTVRQGSAVGPAAPIRVEDMPTEPMAPEQAAAMAQAGQEARAQRGIEQAIQQQPEQQAERRQPALTQDQPSKIDTGRADGRRPTDTSNQDDLRAADGPPGTIAQGSLAAASRRQLGASDSDTAQIRKTTKPTGIDGNASALDAVTGIEQPSAQPPARANLTTSPRPAEVEGVTSRSGRADGGGRSIEPGAYARPTDGFSYASRDKAFVAAVEAGISGRMDPVRGADGRWRLRERPQPANATDPAPPSAAPGRTADAQTATRLAPAALTNAPPSAAQAEAPSESSGNPSSLQTLSMGAIHVDPGRAPELATPGVAVNSLQRASISTGHRAADLRADLIAQIDIAVATAKPDSDADVLAHAEAMARRGSTEPGASQRADKAARRVGYVTFDVPGDGQFTVLNSAGRLASFKRLVQQSAGFKDGSAGTVSKARGAQLGSPTTKTAIEAMIDDGDPQAALDYATAKQIPVEAVGLSPRRLAALSGLVATGAAEKAAGLRADGASPGDRVRQGAGDGRAEPPAPRAKGALRTAADGSPAIEGRLIADAGEKIGGARKDRWAEQGLSLSDLDGMTESEGAQLVTKAAVWRPDFTSMVAAGSHPKAVAMVKLVVDSLAAKPKDNTPAGRRRYVVAMQAVRRAYSDLGQYGQGLHGIEPMARQVLQRAAEKLRNDLNVSGSDAAAQREARAVLFSVYKGRSDPFSLGYSVEQSAARLVADGFPAKAEPWTRRFEIKAIGGAGVTETGTRAYLQLAAELAVDLSADQLRAGGFIVAAKGKPRPAAIAATRVDAEAAAQALYATELQTHTDSKAAPERPHLDVLRRDGLALRIERDVTPDDLLQTFGFRGTEFGNWTAQDERQRMLNLAFDGLSDLAEILGVPPAALSLNGTLGLAFGARGGGRFAAHYEPGKLVINLTKLQGGGSLAHEWAHALDHYLGELDRPDAYQTAARGASGWYARRSQTGKPERRMVREDGRWFVRQERSLPNLRPELAAAVDQVMAALYQKALPQAEAVRAAELRVEQLQARRAEVEPANDAKLLASYGIALQEASRKLAEAQDGMAQGRVPTDFSKQAQKLSGKSAEGYWLRPTEMFARAFESYVFDRLVAMGARSQYLVHGVESDRFSGPNFKGNPYPVGEERAAINAAFGELVNTLQTRSTDKGIALFQRRGQSPAIATASRDRSELNALRALSENDDLFALPRSGGRTVDEIAADIAPQIKVRTTHVSSQETMHRLTLPDGSFALVIERKADRRWPGVYGFDTVGGEEVPITTRPGENPEDVPPETSDVYVDASNLHSGGGGARVYAIASALAHNTGAVFIGDPAGLSDEAMRRRPEQMLSSALKYGTTQHLAPHPRQVRGDAALGIPPLSWVYGDDLGNIRRLVDVNLAALQNAGLNDIGFDPASGHFSDNAGHEIGRSGIGARVATGTGRGALAGSNTLARGAVLRALVREEGSAQEGPDGRRDGLLARVAGLGDEPALAGIFYDRSGASPDPVADPGRLRMVRLAVEQVTATWSNSPKIEVLASMQEAPELARQANARQLAAGASGSPAAFYYGGTVYLLASQMSSAREVAESVAHEALGHYGLRGVFGSGLTDVLRDLSVLREGDVRAKAAQYGLDFDVEAQRLEAAEEVLAALAQTRPEMSLVRRAISAIRAWLRKHLPMLGDLTLTDDEIVRSFILPARAFVVDGQGIAGSAGAAAFARRRAAGDDGLRATPIFRSELLRKVREAKMANAPGSVWKAYIKGLGGVKADEIEWSGVDEWLELQHGKVTRDELANYLADNGVNVSETLIGTDKVPEIRVQYVDDTVLDGGGTGQGRWAIYADDAEIDEASTRELAEAEAERTRNDPAEMALLNGTSFSSFAMPGGKRYRELLLTLPGPTLFKSRHWPDRPNVLAHLRINERTDERGRRVLFVEEIQSDWATALRKQTAGKGDGAWVPAAPFITKTDAWLGLAIKRLVAYAAQEGFDAVAIISGQQASTRFPEKEGDGDGGTLSGMSSFYGEPGGLVLNDEGQLTGRTPVLHNVTRGVLRKLGGGELTTLHLGAGRGRTRTVQMGFEITPAMRQAVADGLPMFSRRAGRTQVEGFRAWLEAGGESARQANMVDTGRADWTAAPQPEAAKPARQALPPTIDVDGQQRPTSNSAGQPLGVDDEAARSFWRRFNGSVIVDAEGRPRLLHHGIRADSRRQFRANEKGALGAGIYFRENRDDARQDDADDRLVAGGSAPGTAPAYVMLRNPFVFDRARFAWPDGLDQADPPDTPITGLLAELLPLEQVSAAMRKARAIPGLRPRLGGQLREVLQAMGHDGLVVRFADPAEGAPTYVAFDRDQGIRAWHDDAGDVASDTGDTSSADTSSAADTPSIRFQRRQLAAEDRPAADFALRPFGRGGRLVELVQDRYNRWKQAIDDVRRQGGSVTDDNNFYRAEERYWGTVGSGLEDFKDQLQGFVKAVAADGLRIEDVALYAYAQHAPERNAWIAARRPDMPDGGSGMTSEEADEILEAAREAGVEAELRRHALTLRRWIQGTRDVLLESGLIDREEYDAWKDLFHQYVPLRGGNASDAAAVQAVGDAGGVVAARRGRPTGGVRGDESERAEGRTSQAAQIIERIAHDRARALIRAGRNNVLRSFARFVLDNPSPSLWEINAVETRRGAVVDEDDQRVMHETESVIRDGRTITLKDAGQEIHILVKDAKLLEQLQRMGVDERPAWAIGALLSANKWLSRAYTSLSPVFTVINGLRDAQAAAIGMIDEIGFLGAPKLFAKLPGAWLESFKAEAGKPSADYQIFRATGGVTHFHNLVTIDQQAKELAAIVADAERSALDPRKALPKAMALIEAINGGIENATRLAAFKVARESGKTTLEAASIAKNITVNFNRKGTQQAANAWVLFFNPAVQGTTRVAKAMTNPKVMAAMGTAMLGVAALALRNAGMGEDDDGVAWWDKIPTEVKERNIVVVLPPGATGGEAVPESKTGRYVKIPMPYGYNFFAVVANQVVDVWRHGQDKRRGRDVVQAGAKAFNAFASSWLPAQDLGRVFAADGSASAGKSAVLLAVPDALDPLARIGLNQDSFGRSMRPEGRFTESLPDSAAYFSGQHGTLFQRGAGALNQATGGSRYQAGIVDVAPSSMEHLARSYGGGPVSFGLDLVNALYVRQNIARPELDAKRLPFARQFYGVIDAETDRLTGYQRLEHTERLVVPIKRAMSAGDGAQAREMRKAAGPVAGLGDAVEQTRAQLGEIVKAERKAIDSAALSDDAKYVKLLELADKRRRVLQRFNKAYDRAVLATQRQEKEDAE